MFTELPDGLKIETVAISYGLSANSYVTSTRLGDEKQRMQGD